jgi:hypothetical protein
VYDNQCTAIGEKSSFSLGAAANVVDYSPASLAVATNNGTYSISLPADSIYNNELASDATARIKGLTTSLEATSRERDTLRALKERVDKMNVEVLPIVIGDKYPGGGGKFYYCGTTVETIKKDLCADAVSARVDLVLQSWGGSCGYNRYVAVCVKY